MRLWHPSPTNSLQRNRRSVQASVQRGEETIFLLPAARTCGPVQYSSTAVVVDSHNDPDSGRVLRRSADLCVVMARRTRVGARHGMDVISLPLCPRKCEASGADVRTGGRHLAAWPACFYLLPKELLLGGPDRSIHMSDDMKKTRNQSLRIA